MTDSEVITTAILLQELHGQLGASNITLVVQFRDVLTQRLMRQQPDLLQPSQADDDDVDASQFGSAARCEVLVLHRNYIETSALTLSAHSHISWKIMRMLLGDYDLGSAHHSLTSRHDTFEVRALPCLRVLPRSARLLSFNQITELVGESGKGVLIGWHRALRAKPKVSSARRNSLFSPSRKDESGRDGKGAPSGGLGALDTEDSVRSESGAPSDRSHFRALANLAAPALANLATPRRATTPRRARRDSIGMWRKSDSSRSGASSPGRKTSRTKAKAGLAVETHEEVEINPRNKDEKLAWCESDLLLLIVRERPLASGPTVGPFRRRSTGFAARWARHSSY